MCETASPEPEAIAHHFSQAGLDDQAIEWWGKAGDLALRRSAFQEAIAHLGKAIAMADKAAGAASWPNAGDATASRRRVKLQAGYSDAVMYHKGFSAEETRVAWARAAELGANRDDFWESSSVRHGQWTLAIVRGELRAAHELASTFLREAEDAGRPVEAGVARRSLGIICYYSGDFLNARIHCERALDECRHDRDLEARERFSDDTGAVAMSILAITSWQLGEVERAKELIDMANDRAAELGHAPSKIHPLYWKSVLEILRGDAAAALITAKAMEGLCREHGMGEWGTVAEMVVGWAHGRLANPTEGAAKMRQALAVLINKGGRLLVAFFQGLLADLELETLGADSAFARIDEALVNADHATNFASLPFLHRLRGDILLKRNPPNIAPAEDAYQTAIAVSRQQERAASSCARRSRSPSCINRPTAPPKATPSSRLRSRAFRRRWKCRRSPRHRRWSRRWRRTSGFGRLSKSGRFALRCIATTPAPFSGPRDGALRRRGPRSSAPMSSPCKHPAMPIIGASLVAGSRFRSCAENFTWHWRLPRPTFGELKSRNGRIMS